MKKIIFFIIFLLLLSCGKKENGDNSGNSSNLSSNNGNIKKSENEKSVEEQIKEMVSIWNEASSNADFDTLEKILGDRIEYYQSSVTKAYYISDQKKFFVKNPVYGQKIKGDIIVTQISNKQVKAEFVKEVTTKKGVKDYPSYLVFENVNGEWKLVLESDTISDANIARMRGGNNKVQRQQSTTITSNNQSTYDYGPSVTIVGTLISRKYQIQLMGEETRSLFDRDILGKRVQVTGELFHSHTAHHHTEVLIMTSNINFLN